MNLKKPTLGKPSLKNKIYESYHNWSVWPKLLKIFENLNYFMASKRGLVLKKLCFLNYGICITDPPPPNFF